MLGAVFFLLIPIYFTGAGPTLWGSRIVGTPEGTSPPMYFRFPNDSVALAFPKDSYPSQIDSKNGTCYAFGKAIGRPCQINGESANITITDVSQMEKIETWDGAKLFSTAIFVPNCTFQKPKTGEVDLNASFPLSRFQKGQSDVQIKFAVGGADSESRASLVVNGSARCEWYGITLQKRSAPFCRNMSRDNTSNLRTFVLNLTRDGALNYTTLEWNGFGTRLVVTVDWEQEGESPEIAACNGYQGKSELEPSQLQPTSSLTTSYHTSAATSPSTHSLVLRNATSTLRMKPPYYDPTTSAGVTATLALHAIWTPLLIPATL